MNKDEASIQDAFWAGQKAGRMLFGASLNPYADDCPEHEAWENGRIGALGMQMAGTVC